MKHLFSLIALLSVCALSTAQNLVQNADFSKAISQTVTNPAKATVGEWFIVNNDKPGVTSILWNQDSSDSMYPASVKFDNTNAPANLSWYKAYLGQRINHLTKGIYLLTFYAKVSEKNTPVSVYIRQTQEVKDAATGKYSTTFFVRDGYNPDTQINSSAAQYNCQVKNAGQWQKIIVKFNTGLLANNINSKKSDPELSITDTPDAADILNDCYMAIWSSTKGSVVSVSNVSLTKVK
jgi:hypothetical protein